MKEQKIVVMGAANVGKSDLIPLIQAKQKRSKIYRPTYGAEVLHQEVTTDDEKTIKCTFFVTSGSERYAGLLPFYQEFRTLGFNLLLKFV